MYQIALCIFSTDTPDIPKITKVSHAVEGCSNNTVLLKWTSETIVDYYIIICHVQDETRLDEKYTDEKSILLENISGTKPTDICIAASCEGHRCDPSSPVRVPIVTSKHMYRIIKCRL